MNKFLLSPLLKSAFAHYFIKTIAIYFLIAGTFFISFAQQPAGFQDNIYDSGFEGANGIAFDDSGRAYIWEKGGKLYCRTLNGTKYILLDIGDEINNATDSGLKGFALHPNFLTNGYFYLLYDVDRYHLFNFGTPNYNPNANDYLNASIGRITRYTIDISNFNSIIPNSRLVILGKSPTDGFPLIHDTHNVGSLVFGTDGTLLASCGESSATNSDPGSDNTTYFQQALADSILKSDDPNTTSVNENENVGSWRAQMVNCLSGKVIRIDPLTGDGIPSNPFYDSTAPRSAKSRVWAMGLRNTFRMTLKPKTGSHSPSAGNPGTLYVGDVGSFRREEINVISSGGQNFGWPKFEGMEESTDAMVYYPFNRETEFSLPITHVRPIVDFRNSSARAYVQTQIREIGTTTPNAVPGIDFRGMCSIGGIFYEGINFPVEYKGRYFHGNFSNGDDPARSWLHSFTMDTNDELAESHSFLTNALGVTGMAVNPVNDYLYYVSYGGSVREVKYDTGNQPPIAKATQDVKYGISPLTVQFDGSLSIDPENGILTYSWNFGDGSAISTNVNPTHIFTTPNPNPTRYDVTLTVTDDQNQSTNVTLIVSVNNTPPIINSTTVDHMNVYVNTRDTTVALQADVTDIETPTAQLAFKWETNLHHDTHFHPNPIDTHQNSSFTMSPLPCDDEIYYYNVKLTVTDELGLSTVKTKNIIPDCGQIYVDTEIPSIPTNLQLVNVSTSKISFSWTASTDNVGVAVYEIFMNDVKIAESSNTNFTAKGLQPSTFYLFKVTAKDAAGNVSPQSVGLGVSSADLPTTDQAIYGDALGTDWQNFSTITSLNIANSSPQYINTRSIKVTNPKAGEALILSYSGFPIDTTGYKNGIDFWVYNEASISYPLQFQAFSTNSGSGGSILGVSAEAHKWTHFLFDWETLGNLKQVGKILIRLNQTQNESIYFDEIKLVHCADMVSVQSGNWNDSTTWSCGRLPISTDIITISAGHKVSVLNGVTATLRILQLLGTCDVQTGGIFNLKNY